MTGDVDLFEVFSATVARQPNRTACLEFGKATPCTYLMLLGKIEEAAASLREAGMQPGACVGLHCPSGLSYIVWAYAIWRCGGTIVPIATELAKDEKLEICTTIRLNGVITLTRDLPIFDGLLRACDAQFSGEVAYIPIDGEAPRPAGFSALRPAFIRFTSGTTASSKGVVLSHSTVFQRILAANDVLNIGPDDRVLWLLSMSYHFTVSIVAYLSFGATIILCKDHFGSTMVEAASEGGATFIYGSPQHYRAMASDASGRLFGQARLAISTATALRNDVAQAFFRRFGLPLSQAYGIIEIGLPCINLAGEEAKPGSVGRPLPAFDIRLTEILPGGPKAISVRGSGMLDAYYIPWRPQAEIMPDGWFYTGDLGEFDADGFLSIVGRAKEMISVAGMKLFPQEVEAVLETHSRVQEAYVYAEPHDRLGEIPCALVLAVPGQAHAEEAELRSYCAKHLTSYKVPEKIRYVAELPKTASGKLKRNSALPVGATGPAA
ncbi:long-chain acyl-CoA synthetase [Angulomicrobium tetraedrale]|uniref:Long-chain acyl-CoA synthetase n=1 Tax=Ancylobacter tetraedralis TaxID=217068 RepID=A0A839ZAC7_9HYPH|nr:class I adenylate-forming enzyme family protein [Ancylobacter tetraedralis]MBB3771677.1 long-chain acyl-CoA synthetase [Ancylobacter tetraedralis]